MLNGQKPLGSKTIDQFIVKFSGIPYKYGYHDCFHLCLRWIEHNTGESLRGLYPYHDIQSGLAMMGRYNKNRIFDLFDNHLKQTTTPKAGDLVAWDENNYGACGIMCEGGFYSVDSKGAIGKSRDMYFKAWALDE